MASSKVVQVINDVQVLLNDAPGGAGEKDGDLWKFNELLTYLNIALRDIVVRSITVRSSPANIVRKEIPLVAGSEQDATLEDPSVVAVLSVLRNKGGPDIEEIHDATLAQVIDNWRSRDDTGKEMVQFWIPDKISRTLFSIYPPQPDPPVGVLDTICAAIPDRVTSTDNFPLPEIYIDAAMAYTRFMALSRDQDIEENVAAASAALQLYLTNPVFAI